MHNPPPIGPVYPHHVSRAVKTGRLVAEVIKRCASRARQTAADDRESCLVRVEAGRKGRNAAAIVVGSRSEPDTLGRAALPDTYSSQREAHVLQGNWINFWQEGL